MKVVEVDRERGRIGLRLAEDPEIQGKNPDELQAIAAAEGSRGGRGRDSGPPRDRGGRGGRDRGGRGGERNGDDRGARVRDRDPDRA